MKKILDGLGAALIGLVIVIVIIIVLPISLVGIAIFGTVALYGWIWKKVRSDPRRDLAIEGLGWQETEDTLEQHVAVFETICNRLVELSKAEQSQTVYEGLEELKTLKPNENKPVSLERILYSEHAELRLRFDLLVHREEPTDQMIAFCIEDTDVEMPPIEVEVTKPILHTKRNITITSDQAAWIVIGFLRGDVKFTHERGQLWTFIPEHKVWLVQYKNNGGSYGLRATFNNKVAHEYGYDK